MSSVNTQSRQRRTPEEAERIRRVQAESAARTQSAVVRAIWALFVVVAFFTALTPVFDETSLLSGIHLLIAEFVIAFGLAQTARG